MADSVNSCKLADEHDFIHATAGIHLHYTKDASDILSLRELALHPNVVAIGELILIGIFACRNSTETI